MDGVGKSTLAKKCADLFDGFFVVKAIHPLRDQNVYHDNFYNICDLVLDICKHDFNQCMFGIRGIFWYYRLNGYNIVSDRFYASNLWHVERRDVDIEKIVKFVGIPEKTILLYASQNVLQKRISARNPHDKDLEKIKQAEYAYNLMKIRFRKNRIHYSIIDTDNLSLMAVVDRILSIVSKYDVIQTAREDVAHAFFYTPTENNEIFIDEKIKEIDPKAFFYLSNLQHIKVADSNPYFSSIDGVLYSKRKDILYNYPRSHRGKKFKIPKTVKYLMHSAFINASMLEDIVAHDEVIEIGSTCFFNCHALKSFFIPAGIHRIGAMNFLGCTVLKSFSVSPENSMYSENMQMLFSKDKTVLIRIPPAIDISTCHFFCKKVLAWAGAEVSTIRQIDFGKELETIEAYAFFRSEIERISVNSSNLIHIGERAFASCKKLRSLDISLAPASISIHREAFEGVNDNLKIYVSQTLFDHLAKDSKRENIKSYLVVKLFNKEYLSCAAACCLYLCKQLNVNILVDFERTYWIFSIVRQLSSSIKCQLFYGESKLMQDYYAHKLPEDFPFKADLEDVIQSNKICCRKIEKNDLINIVRESFVLMIVDSGLLNRSLTLSSGHYIVIERIEEAHAIIMNPLNTIAVRQFADIDMLVASCLKQGGWFMSIDRAQSGDYSGGAERNKIP